MECFCFRNTALTLKKLQRVRLVIPIVENCRYEAPMKTIRIANILFYSMLFLMGFSRAFGVTVVLEEYEDIDQIKNEINNPRQYSFLGTSAKLLLQAIPERLTHVIEGSDHVMFGQFQIVAGTRSEELNYAIPGQLPVLPVVIREFRIPVSLLETVGLDPNPMSTKRFGENVSVVLSYITGSNKIKRVLVRRNWQDGSTKLENAPTMNIVRIVQKPDGKSERMLISGKLSTIVASAFAPGITLLNPFGNLERYVYGILERENNLPVFCLSSTAGPELTALMADLISASVEKRLLKCETAEQPITVPYAPSYGLNLYKNSAMELIRNF